MMCECDNDIVSMLSSFNMEDTFKIRFSSFNEMKATFYLEKHSDINEFT